MTVSEIVRSEPEFARPLAVGAVAGVIVFVVGGVAMSLAAGFDTAGSLGIALFIAFWGGLGFGAMFGAIYAIARSSDH